jgi:hypothetical protein
MQANVRRKPLRALKLKSRGRPFEWTVIRIPTNDPPDGKTLSVPHNFAQKMLFERFIGLSGAISEGIWAIGLQGCSKSIPEAEMDVPSKMFFQV